MPSKPRVLTAQPGPFPPTRNRLPQQIQARGVRRQWSHSALSDVVILTSNPQERWRLKFYFFWHEKQMVSFSPLLRNRLTEAIIGLTLLPPHMHMLLHTYCIDCSRTGNINRKGKKTRQLLSKLLYSWISSIAGNSRAHSSNDYHSRGTQNTHNHYSIEEI